MLEADQQLLHLVEAPFQFRRIIHDQLLHGVLALNEVALSTSSSSSLFFNNVDSAIYDNRK